MEFGGLSAEAIEDPELTELDLEEEGEVVHVQPVAAKPARPKPAAANADADPFAETFEEEEIVLDNFAGWGDMFRQDTPRVENGRDRDFAALVQSVLDKCGSTTRKPLSSVPPFVVDGSNNPVDELVKAPTPRAEPILRVEHDADHAEEDEYQIEDCWPTMNAAAKTPTEDCPPLRLAVVNEPTPLKPIPLVLPKGLIASLKSKNYAPVVPKEIDPAEDWTKNPPPRIATQKWTADAPDRGPSPILIIEEEAAATTTVKSPVRREEYRQLFTRLRHGT